MAKRLPEGGEEDLTTVLTDAGRSKKKKRSEKRAGQENSHVPVAPAAADNDTALWKRNRKERKKNEKREQKQELREKAQSESQSRSSTCRTSPTSTPAMSVGQDGSGLILPTPKDPISSNVEGLSYVQHPGLSALPQTTIDAYLSSASIHISDPTLSTLRPITTFPYLPSATGTLCGPLKAFSAPTPIQSSAWPFLFEGRDVIGVAETGSGKTLAFGLPCIWHLSRSGVSEKRRRRGGVYAVIITPTRELAIQVHKQILEISDTLSIKTACVYGGVNKCEQRAALKEALVVVATPGRLKDLVSEGAVDLSRVEYLVLDEADRMLDKGFEDDIKEILSHMPDRGSRQTSMFTATWPTSVQELAAQFMTSPVWINIGDSQTSELRANPRIKQVVEVLDPRDKDSRLMQLLDTHHRKDKKGKILIFCLYKKEAARLEQSLRRKGLQVSGIHGDMNQAERIKSLDAFRSGKVPLLVATDVAARGLDIPAVKLVLNVTFPLTVEDYVHRIGRTGRAGADGTAITLFTELDKAQSGSLINVLKAAKQPVPEALLRFGTTVKKKQHQTYGAFFKDIEGMRPATKIKFDN